MTSYIERFIPICSMQTKSTQYKLNHSRTIPLQLILINEGSYTKTIQYLNNTKTRIKTLQKYCKKLNKVDRKIRYVWLETSIYAKLTFARSLWLLVQNKRLFKSINKTSPIGLSFIENKIDIHKNIHEIYYGYCQNFEKELEFKGPVWGRKYTLYYKNHSSVTIQEIFSPNILRFFH